MKEVNSRSPRHMRRSSWSCELREQVPVFVNQKEWKYILETVSRSLYQLHHQLQKNDRPYSPVKTAEINNALIPTDLPVREDGAPNGEELFTKAS